MEQENNKYGLLNAFKYDIVIWGIIAAISVIIFYFDGAQHMLCGGQWSTSMACVGIGVFMTVIISHLQPRCFKIVTPVFVILTVLMLIVTSLMEASAQRWLSIAEIPFSPLWFTAPAICLILSSLVTLKDSRSRILGVCNVMVLCSLCMILDVLYACTLVVLTVLIMFFFNIYRKRVLTFVGGLFIADVLTIGIIFAFGRTKEERMDDDLTISKIEYVSSFQHRLDHMKERFISGLGTNTQPDNNIVISHTKSKNNDNILASTYHCLYKHSWVWGCIFCLAMYIFLLCRVVDRVHSTDKTYIKCLAVSCSFALITDSIYNSCMAKYVCFNAATSVYMHYIIIGVILSCIGMCPKDGNVSVKNVFQEQPDF